MAQSTSALTSLFFNDAATPEIYTLSLHDALPIFADICGAERGRDGNGPRVPVTMPFAVRGRSEEHTSELQSRLHLVCRLLLEKKKYLQPPGASTSSSGYTAALGRRARSLHR